ncbi:MAG: acetylxylan esterase [Acidobacteriia bacterium]|nr:acetylxylan esterase [Terriglobia bacterium]
MRAIFRSFAVLFLALALSPFLAAQVALTEADLRVVQGGPREKDFERMLPDYLQRLAADATGKRRARLEAIHSEADFRSWQESNRKNFLDLIGGLPEARTPLNARAVGEVAREGYVVRKLIYDSLPEYYVTANLYVPTTGAGPFPAVLAPCGHSSNGKAYEVYQHLFIGLAKRGYVVLAYDPVGQGERTQYWDFINHRKLLGGPDNEHAMAGLQEMLMGQNLARYFIWDGIRGLDYLTGLPEVDAARIGVTGNSGGGTLTTYISMLDPRVKAASIVTFISSLPKKIEARSLDAEADPEQDIPGLLAAGIDHTEFVGMIAPRPVQIGAATRDFFPIEGTRATFAELQALYLKLGVPERIKMVEFDHRHMYSQPLREATYAWFDRWLKGQQGEAQEPSIVTEKDETLECSPTGQVITSLGGKRLCDFNRAEAEQLLQRLATRRDQPAFREGLAARIRERLALPLEAPAPKAEAIGKKQIGDIAIETLLLETEPGIVVPTRVIHRKDSFGRLPAVIYLRDRLGERDRLALYASLARAGKLIVVADVRGFGETWSPRSVRETSADYFDPRDGVDADFAYGANFLGKPLLGMRVWDALNVAAYARSRADVDPKRIALAARGWSAPVALFAAALDPSVQALAVEGMPACFGALAMAEIYEQPAEVFLPGALREFDLEDVFSLFAPRRCLLLNPQDALTRKMTREEAQQSVKGVHAPFAAVQGPASFQVVVRPLESETLQALENWLDTL